MANVFFCSGDSQVPAWKKIISNKTFKDRLALVAIDEAHCISEWLVYLYWFMQFTCHFYSGRGKDFRMTLNDLYLLNCGFREI